MKVEAGGSTYLVSDAPGEDPAFQLMILLCKEPNEFWVGLSDEDAQKLPTLTGRWQSFLPPRSRRNRDSEVIPMGPITPKPFNILVKP